MPTRPELAIALALALASPPALAAGRSRAKHPDVGAEQECAACHRTQTAASFEAWERSPHGVALVKCVACHGSAGADFRPKPAATSCEGCHPVQVASLAKKSVRDCYACHSPHALTANPHR
jgi:hypothetical protein